MRGSTDVFRLCCMLAGMVFSFSSGIAGAVDLKEPILLQSRNGVLEGIDARFDLPFETNLHENADAETDRFGVEQGDVTPDQAFFFERAHSSKARGR